MLRAVLFDMDGTLLDHESASAAAGEDFVRRLRPDLPVAEAVSLWTDDDRNGYDLFLAGELTFQQRRRYAVRGLAPALAEASDDEVDAVFETYLADYRSRWRPYDDARPALAAVLDLGLRVAIVSNNSWDQTREKAEVVGLSPEVAPIVASESVGAPKPDPRIFVAACEAVGSRAEETLMVGDDLRGDVLGALGAGLRAAWPRRPAATGGAVPADGPAPGATYATMHTLAALSRVLGRG